MEAIVGPILSALIAAAPGLLALITGKQSDEEARALALSRLSELRLIDVDGILAAHRRPASIEAAVRARVEAPLVHSSDVDILRPLADGSGLAHEQRAALGRLLAAVQR